MLFGENGEFIDEVEFSDIVASEQKKKMANQLRGTLAKDINNSDDEQPKAEEAVPDEDNDGDHKEVEPEPKEAEDEEEEIN